MFSLFLNTNKQVEKLSRPILANIYYKNYYKCLLTNKIHFYSIENFFKTLKKNHWEQASHFQVIHLLYELNFYDLSDVDEETALAIEINYEKLEAVNEVNKKANIHLTPLSSPKYLDYLKKFEKVQYHLKEGNCYQVNLTERYLYQIENSPEDFIDHFINNASKLSEFAHLTFIPEINKMYYSNSPESLFNLTLGEKKIEITSRPIKGTIKYNKEHDSFEEKWNELINSKKDEAELYMIADLIRNDLAQIEKPTAKILSSKKPLEVPGLIHQYAELSLSCSKNISLYSILSSLFPGGSITGAPKKRVRKIIKAIESNDRGFYCSTTLRRDKNKFYASINIRSASIDFIKSTLEYGSGGGITIKSLAEQEFNEMNAKTESFLSLFCPK